MSAVSLPSLPSDAPGVAWGAFYTAARAKICPITQNITPREEFYTSCLQSISKTQVVERPKGAYQTPKSSAFTQDEEQRIEECARILCSKEEGEKERDVVHERCSSLKKNA